MKTMLIVLFLIESKVQLVINMPCECAHINEEQKCNNSKRCLWNIMVEKCLYHQNVEYNNEIPSFCSQFVENECILNKRCVFHLGKCQDFTKCENLLKDKCSSSSFWCISNGQSCMPKNECQEYYNKQACENKNIHDKYCIWKTSNEFQKKCQDTLSCEDLPSTLFTHNECREQIQYCTTSNQGGCIKQKDYCHYYTFKEQCFQSNLNIKCFWEEQSQQCFEKKCSNKILKTYEECSQFLSNCTTNGIHCIEKLSCYEYQFQSGCVKDNQGKLCIYYQGRCYSKTCDQAPDSVQSLISCQLFSNESQECVPKRNGGCKNQPNQCNLLETQDACQIITQQDGSKCIWNDTLSLCKVKECIDAPLNFDNKQCISWLTDYECISSLGNGCIQNFENCNQIKNLKSCIKNKNKKKCIIENDECFEEECFNFKYPKYDSHKKCQDRMSICTYNYLIKSCVNRECQNLSEKECNYDFNFNKCFLPSGCAQKRCESAQLQINSYEDCQNWDIRCNVNIVVINNMQIIYGCITQYLNCNQYKYQQQCKSTLQGILCYWNFQTMECEFQTCNNAPLSFNTINQCQEWVKYHNQKCVIKQNGGCIEKFPQCEQLTEELQCNIGSLNSLCYWNTQTNNCQKRTCMNASMTINTNLLCRDWLPSCKLNQSGFGCQIDSGVYEQCTDAPETEQFNTHKECEAWNPKCTLKLGSTCANKLECQEYLTEKQCLIDLNNQPCKWDGTSCKSIKCSDYPSTPTSYLDCFLFSNACTISTQKVNCQEKKLSCSSYVSEDCNVNLDDQKCLNIASSCVEVKNQLTYLRHSCSYEDLHKGFKYQYFNETCIETPQSCNSLTQNQCNYLTTINNELCSWDGTQCLMILSPTNSQVDCRNQISLYQVDCKNVSNNCELDFIQFARCTYSTCLSVQEHQCNFITLNRNVQCTWNSSICHTRTCFNMNEEFTSTYQCILWLDSCTYDQNKKACIDRTSCNQESSELLCNKASYITENEQKVYCYWNANFCTDITTCSQINNSTSHRMCQDKLSICTSLTTFITAQCIEAPLFCNQIQEKKQCIRNSKFEFCQWINGQCWQKRCSLGGRQKTESYISCQRKPRSQFCVFNQQTRRCEEFKECQFIAGLDQNEMNCVKYSSLCRMNEQYNGCIRNTKCTQATTYFQYNCDLFLLHRKCRRKKYTTSCQPLAQACQQYKSQENCMSDYQLNKCYWKVTLNRCVNLSCQEIDQNVKSHSDCQSISSNCTISIQNQTYSCINLLSCNQYSYEEQCVIDNTYQICSWIDNKCILDNCRNSAINTVYDIQLCEQNYGSNCTINEDRSGCIYKQKMCKNYNLFQCLTPDQRNLFGEFCFWDQINQICSEAICELAPSHYNQLTECQSYNYNCQPAYCRQAKCQDFIYDTDKKCSVTLTNNQCTSNGFRCIERKQCENAMNIQACTYSIDYLDCQWLEDDNRCVIKSCSSAPINISTHLGCQQYFQGCSAKINGGCSLITTCNSIQTQEGCQQDQFKINCLWDDNLNQCIYLQCETICGDGIVGGYEECDDGNILPYDGCYKCKIQCQYGCDICTQQMCQVCTDGYELNSNGICYEICGDGIIVGQEECDDMNDIEQDGCYNCRFQCQQQCIICTQGICLLCEYGWEQYNNQCRSICGNGQRVELYEQCDDGNTDNFDGCDSNCNIEKDWICNQSEITRLSECINQVAPKVQLQNISQKKDKKQNILFSFNQEIKLKDHLNLEDYISINITNNAKFNFTILSLNQAMVQLSNVQYIIEISILQQVSEPYATISFLKSIIVNNLNQELTELSSTISLGTPIILSLEAQKRLESTIKFNEIMIYIFIGSSTLSVLTGNFDLFFNMLALLQQLSYVRYLSIPFPSHLEEYLKVFKVISFQPLYDKLQIDYYFSKLNFGQPPFIQSNSQRKDDPEFNNAFFLVNAKSFYIALLTSFVLYSLSKLIQSFRYLIFTKLLKYLNFKKLQILYKLLKAVSIFSEKTTKYFIYSGIIKVFISTQYQLMYSAYSQFPKYQFKMKFENWFTTFNSFNALIAIILPHLFLFKSIVVLKKQYKKTTQNKYEIFYENVKPTYWARFFIPFQMIKVSIYMGIVCFVFSSSIIQIISLTILSNAYFCYLMFVQPCTLKSDLLKNLVRELTFIIIISSFFPYILQIDDEIIYIFGWVHIGLFSLIVASNILIDFINQFQQLLNKISQNKQRKIKRQQELENNQNYQSLMIIPDNNNKLLIIENRG